MRVLVDLEKNKTASFVLFSIFCDNYKYKLNLHFSFNLQDPDGGGETDPTSELWPGYILFAIESRIKSSKFECFFIKNINNC